MINTIITDIVQHAPTTPDPAPKLDTTYTCSCRYHVCTLTVTRAAALQLLLTCAYRACTVDQISIDRRHTLAAIDVIDRSTYVYGEECRIQLILSRSFRGSSAAC